MKLVSDKNIIKDLKKEINEASIQAKEDMKKIRLVEENTLKDIEDYKKSKAFKKTEALTYTYEYDFKDCKAEVKELYPDLDLKEVILQLEEEEEEGKEEEATKEGEIQEEHIEEAILLTIPEETMAKEMA